jgi:hypothetical protein
LSTAIASCSAVTWLRYHSAPTGCTFTAPKRPAVTCAPSLGLFSPPNAAPSLLSRNVPSFSAKSL